ncbi:hypothetical protein [Serratia fonticola]|uniref:hypothetical protein n=1 Tax=Serratia fonticola TaxID=47917 RepID=UPI001C52EDAE|nr:hypothetical protein [Serratia fonticola]
MSKCPERDTLSSVVIEATQQMLIKTGESCAHFATTRLIPTLEIQGLINIGSAGITADSYTRWRSRSIKQAERVLSGEVRMPADWVITWVSALPEPFRGECQMKLAALQGLLWVRLPKYTRRTVRSVDAELDAITIKFGDVLAAAAPAHDGVYDSNDNQGAVLSLQNRLFELIAFLAREINNIESATGIAPDAIKIGRHSPLNDGGC